MPKATPRNAWTWLAPPGSGYCSKADTGSRRAFFPSRQRTQLARIEQPHRIDGLAKGELAAIGVEAAAILELEDVRVVGTQPSSSNERMMSLSRCSVV